MSNGHGVVRLIVIGWVTAVAAMSLAVFFIRPARPLAEPDRPRLEVSASPRIALGPAVVTIYAKLRGPEVERYYCPRVVFAASDGTENWSEPDCKPFEEREEYPRFWSRHYAVGRCPFEECRYEVTVWLEKAGKVLTRASVEFEVR